MICSAVASLGRQPSDTGSPSSRKIKEMLRFAQALRGLGDRVEHRLNLRGRSADDVEHVAGRRLILQCFLQLLVRACTSSNSRAFSIAITAWSANVVTSSICFSVKGATAVRARMMTPINVPSRSSGTPKTVRCLPIFLPLEPIELRISKHVGHVNCSLLDCNPTDHGTAINADRVVRKDMSVCSATMRSSATRCSALSAYLKRCMNTLQSTASRRSGQLCPAPAAIGSVTG